MRPMRRLTLPLAAAALLLVPAAALANTEGHDQGHGWYPFADDKVVTNAGFIVILAFPLIVLLLSLLQARLEKRKDARKRAAKARAASRQWQGGW